MSSFLLRNFNLLYCNCFFYCITGRTTIIWMIFWFRELNYYNYDQLCWVERRFVLRTVRENKIMVGICNQKYKKLACMPVINRKLVMSWTCFMYTAVITCMKKHAKTVDVVFVYWAKHFLPTQVKTSCTPAKLSPCPICKILTLN